MKRREWKSLQALFGKEVVDEAIANEDRYQQWALAHEKELTAAGRLLSELRNDPQAATLFVEKLDPKLRGALVIAMLKYYTGQI